MSDWCIAPCDPASLSAVVDLVNSAYRGQSSRAGWTTEADYIDSPRTSLKDLTEELAAATRPTLLVLRRAGDPEVLACAMVEPLTVLNGERRAYIGMVTVKPTLQAAGLGRVILRAAEDHARAGGAHRARMTVVSIRDTLIAWYERRGYRLTGERLPFPYDEPRFGIPRQPGLEFAVLEKPLTDPA